MYTRNRIVGSNPTFTARYERNPDLFGVFRFKVNGWVRTHPGSTEAQRAEGTSPSTATAPQGRGRRPNNPFFTALCKKKPRLARGFFVSRSQPGVRAGCVRLFDSSVLPVPGHLSGVRRPA